MTAVAASAELNVETPLAALEHGITPRGQFYRRTNFYVPEIDPASWELQVCGEVEAPFTLDLDELRALPRHSVAMTMECAGNARRLVTPATPGHQWEHGAVSTAVFTGVSLRTLLERARPGAGAVEVLFTGADTGSVGGGRTEPFARRIPLALAQDPDVLLAWEMNGEPLPAEHGYPLRLVVPRWYGVASVKWLTEVRVIAEPFRGHFQFEKYVYLGEPGIEDGTPVTRMRVRSLIAQPSAGDEVTGGVPVEIRGCAWSGDAPVERVEVSADGGRTWSAAQLGAAPSAHAAAPWRLLWIPPRAGAAELIARATDAAGHTQPLDCVWNELGYGNNAVQRVPVTIV